MRRGRATRITLLSMGALVILGALFAAFIVFTTPGAKLALTIANRRELPVRVGAVEGALASRFLLRDVVLDIGPVHASIDTMWVTWRPWALRDRRVDLEDVTIAGLRLVVAEDSATAETAEAPRDTSRSEPWGVTAERVRVRGGQVDAPGDVHLHDVDIRASGGPDGYRADVRARGSVWRFDAMDAFARVSGNTSGATADSLDVRMLGGAVHGSAFVRWQDRVSLRGRVHGDSLRVGELANEPDDWLGAVSFRARGTALLADDSTQIGVDVEALDGVLRERELFARGRVDMQPGRIEASDVRIRWGSARAELSGLMADVADVKLDATVPALGEILPRARGSASVRGRLTGTPERVVIDITATGRDIRTGRVDLPNFDATIDGALNARNYVPDGAEIRRADVRVGNGGLSVHGDISWRDGVAWDASLATDSFEVSTLTPARWNLHGPVSITTTTSGHVRGNRRRAQLAIESLSGTLRDRAIGGSGRVALDRRELRASQLHLEWGDARVDVDGVAGDTLSFSFDVAASNLAAFDTSLAGAVSMRGSARGPRNQPAVEAVVSADSLRVLEYAVRRLDGDIDADLGLASPGTVHVLALGAVRGNTMIDTVRVDASGRRDDHDATIAVVQGDTRAAVTLHGAYVDSTWQGWVEDVRVRHHLAGEWRSSGRAPVLVSASRVQVDSLALASAAARLAASANWQRGDSARAHVDLRGFELSRFEPYLVDGMKVTGALEGAIHFTQDPHRGLRARADLAVGPGEIAFQDKKADFHGRAGGRADSTGVFADVELDVNEAGATLVTVDAKASIPGYVAGRDSLGSQPIEGGLDVDCRNIAPVLTMFAPRIANASGTFTMHVTPSGIARDFRLLGRADLENARVDLPSGVRLRDTDLSLVSDGTGNVTLDGAVTSGGGRVVLQARSARSEKTWVNGTFTAKGERFQIINQPEAQVFVSPNVEVRVEERTANVTGSVRVPFARIETTQVPASAASRSSDVVFVEDTLSTRHAVAVKTQLAVELGDSVSFSGFGLRGRLTGSLTVTDESSHPTQGSGEIQIVDGKYRAFGNELTIDPGRFVFGGGPIDNPGLDVRAYRGLSTSQNVMTGSGEIVGVNLRGTLRRPEVTVFSNPAMSESEIMSYLVLGRPMSSSGDQSALASAALLYGMQQGTNMAGDIGKHLALDDAYIEGGSEAKETSFVAGKYLSPKLYVSYAAGLFEHTNTFRVRYSLGRRWTLQAESGQDSSTDLLYWFENGK